MTEHASANIVLMVDDELGSILNTWVVIRESLGSEYVVLRMTSIAVALTYVVEHKTEVLGAVIDAKMPCSPSDRDALTAALDRSPLATENFRTWIGRQFLRTDSDRDKWHGVLFAVAIRTLCPHARICLLSAYLNAADLSPEEAVFLRKASKRLEIAVLQKPASANAVLAALHLP
jgi:hypothetical protein